MFQRYPVSDPFYLHPHQVRHLLWFFACGETWGKLDPWGSLTALQVGQVMHDANAYRCRTCDPGAAVQECPIQDHHFYQNSGECESCRKDGTRALIELADQGLVELSGTPTEMAKEMQFELEAADLLDPSRDHKEAVPNE